MSKLKGNNAHKRSTFIKVYMRSLYTIGYVQVIYISMCYIKTSSQCNAFTGYMAGLMACEQTSHHEIHVGL
jgi:hypothetical protein